MTKREMNFNIKHCVNRSTAKKHHFRGSVLFWMWKKLMIKINVWFQLKTFCLKSGCPSAQISRNVATLTFLQQLWPLLLLLPCSNRSICTSTGNWTQTNLTERCFFFLVLLGYFLTGSLGRSDCDDSSCRKAAKFLTVASKCWQTSVS